MDLASSIAGWEMWGGFLIFVFGLLALDLGIFHRQAHEVSLKEAGVWSVVWVALATAFGVGVFHFFWGAKSPRVCHGLCD